MQRFNTSAFQFAYLAGVVKSEIYELRRKTLTKFISVCAVVLLHIGAQEQKQEAPSRLFTLDAKSYVQPLHAIT